MKSYSKLWDWILSPFTKDLPFFVLMLVLIGAPNIYLHLNLNAYSYVLYLGMMYYVLAYLLSHLTSWIKPISKWIKVLCLLYGLIYAVLNYFCISTYKCMLSGDFIEIIAGTNPDEATEFFRTFVSWWDVIMFVGVIIIVPIVYCKLLHNKVILTWRKSILPLSLLFISVAGLCHNFGMITHEVKGGNNWNFKFDEIVDLREHPTNPVLEEVDSIHPQNIVVILGESFSKNHSSLYGYDRETNPLLNRMKEAGNLIVFDHVTAPAPSTTKAFKFLLTTFTLEDESKEKKWYEYTNVIEAFKSIGFQTTWISCQNEKGMFDNLPSGYSRLCDSAIFDTRTEKPKYDDFLIDAYSPDTIETPALIFYHLMGQHEGFSDRYPDEYCHFGPKNKKGLGSAKEAVINDYDNATLFNDYVVSSIMDLYKEENAIILYFPDHGLDVCDTDSTYFGHATATPESQAHCKQIPFVVYVTYGFKDSHSSVVEKLNNRSKDEFCTDKLIYLLLDIAGYRLQ